MVLGEATRQQGHHLITIFLDYDRCRFNDVTISTGHSRGLGSPIRTVARDLNVSSGVLAAVSGLAEQYRRKAQGRAATLDKLRLLNPSHKVRIVLCARSRSVGPPNVGELEDVMVPVPTYEADRLSKVGIT